MDLVPQWFDSLRGFWASTSPNVAKRVVNATFPLVTAGRPGADVVERAQSWLEANGDAPSVLRACVVEGLTEARRAIAAQERAAG